MYMSIGSAFMPNGCFSNRIGGGETTEVPPMNIGEGGVCVEWMVTAFTHDFVFREIFVGFASISSGDWKSINFEDFFRTRPQRETPVTSNASAAMIDYILFGKKI